MCFLGWYHGRRQHSLVKALEPFLANSILSWSFPPEKVLLLLPADFQLQNSCPAAAKISGRLLCPAAFLNIPQKKQELSGISGRGEGMELRGISGQGKGIRASQREPVSVPCPKKATEMDVKHSDPGNVWWVPTGCDRSWDLSPLLPLPAFLLLVSTWDPFPTTSLKLGSFPVLKASAVSSEDRFRP